MILSSRLRSQKLCMVKKTDDIDMSNAARELVFFRSVSRECISHNGFFGFMITYGVKEILKGLKSFIARPNVKTL